MSDTEPPPFVTFREPQRPRALDSYALAIELTAHVFEIIELAQTERFHLKDQLDRRSTAIPLLIAQARDTPGGPLRRKLLDAARRAAMDCRSLIDILHERRTVEESVLDPARLVTDDLIARLTGAR